MQNARLKFDEENHLYYLDGKPIPSVTTVLADVGLYPDFSMIDPWYAERGSLVHLACHYDNQGRLNESTVDEKIAGYLESFRKFKNDYEVEIIESEMRLFNEAFWYAGTADGHCELNWNRVRREALYDIKCGPPMHGYQFQLAGYGYAKGLHYSTLRLGVYLKKDGSAPAVREYLDPDDISLFQSATNVYHAKRRKAA